MECRTKYLDAYPDDRNDVDNQMERQHMQLPNMRARRGQQGAPKEAPKEWKDLSKSQLVAAAKHYRLQFNQYRLVTTGSKIIIASRLENLTPFAQFWPLPLDDGSNQIHQINDADGDGDNDDDDDDDDDDEEVVNLGQGSAVYESDQEEDDEQPQALLPVMDMDVDEEQPQEEAVAASSSSSSSSSSGGRSRRARAPQHHANDLVRCMCGCESDVIFRDTRPCSGCYSDTFYRVATRCVSRSYYCENCQKVV